MKLKKGGCATSISKLMRINSINNLEIKESVIDIEYIYIFEKLGLSEVRML